MFKALILKIMIHKCISQGDWEHIIAPFLIVTFLSKQVYLNSNELKNVIEMAIFLIRKVEF